MGTFNFIELRSWPNTVFTTKQFHNKSRYILQRATDIVAIKFYTARGSNDRQTFDWMNSVKFKASLCQIKHWTYQTLSECILACVMILPIEEYKQLNQASTLKPD